MLIIYIAQIVSHIPKDTDFAPTFLLTLECLIRFTSPPKKKYDLFFYIVCILKLTVGHFYLFHYLKRSSQRLFYHVSHFCLYILVWFSLVFGSVWFGFAFLNSHWVAQARSGWPGTVAKPRFNLPSAHTILGTLTFTF